MKWNFVEYLTGRSAGMAPLRIWPTKPVHDHLKFCRELHREIARLRAAQNAIDISGGTTKSCPLWSTP